MKYVLKRSQQLNCDIATAWNFFSSPGNLSKITPESMNFTVLSKKLEPAIFEGMIIDYKVSPMFGIRLNWRTEIRQVEFDRSFTDFQVKGPYKLWNHFHEFIPNKDGVLMNDTVTYELPMAILGDLMHTLVVKNKLNQIFDYRYKVLEKLFNSTN